MRLLAFFLIAVSAASAQTRTFVPVGGRRVALVIGMNAYPERLRLTTALSDAKAVEGALPGFGFEPRNITAIYDAKLEPLKRSIRGFIGGIRHGDTVFVYYAGHGVEVQGRNYLLPIDFSADADERQIRDEGYAAQTLLEDLESSGARARIMVLDACRDNPLRKTRSTMRGLASMEGVGTLVIFPTAAGRVTRDDGLFRREMLKGMAAPGVPADEAFKRIGRAVFKATNGAQVPAMYGLLLEDFAFVEGAEARSNQRNGAAVEGAPRQRGGEERSGSPSRNGSTLAAVVNLQTAMANSSDGRRAAYAVELKRQQLKAAVEAKQKTSKEAEEELRAERVKQFAALGQDSRLMVTKFGQVHRWSMVLDTSADAQAVLWANPQIDMTQDLTNALDKGRVVGSIASQLIGHVVGLHLRSAVTGSRAGREAIADLETRFEPRKKFLEAALSEIERLRERLKQDSRKLNAERRRDLTRQLEAKSKAYEREKESVRTEMEAERSMIVSRLSQRIMQAVDQYARHDGIQLVIDFSDPRSRIWYASPEFDITTNAIRHLDTGAVIETTYGFGGMKMAVFNAAEILGEAKPGQSNQQRLEQVVRAYGAERRYSLLFDVSGTETPVLWATPGSNVTEELKQIYQR